MAKVNQSLSEIEHAFPSIQFLDRLYLLLASELGLEPTLAYQLHASKRQQLFLSNLDQIPDQTAKCSP